MRRLSVYADFDWLSEAELVGELGYESLRGSESFCFTFSNDWLRRHADVFLCEDLNIYPGPQYAGGERGLFGCFADVLPDRWGRTLLWRREQTEALAEGRPARRLSSFDFLTGIDDFSRMGALRFMEEGEFIHAGGNLSIPPLTDVHALLAASQELETCEEDNRLPALKWIAQLVEPGSSLGGARPKASVRDAGGRLCIAKFPSRRDDYDVGLWEHFAHLLAEEAGVQAAQTEVIDAGGRHHTLLSQRFDRKGEGRRVHFASAMALLGLRDGDGASTGHGYLDIVDFIIRHCTRVEDNLRELYRRVAFNICIGNSDDHFRNHGFLLTRKGWTLAPAYDMNPSLSEWQALMVSAASNRADLSVLLGAHEDYLISKREAERIVDEVAGSVSGWRSLAKRLGMAKREVDLFAAVLDARCKRR